MYYNITNTKCEKLFGIRIDYKVNFNTHTDEICRKAGKKVSASKVTSHMDLSKRRVLVHSIFLSHFSIWSLVWMCYNMKFSIITP